jgi:hypothetical protein
MKYLQAKVTQTVLEMGQPGAISFLRKKKKEMCHNSFPVFGQL